MFEEEKEFSLLNSRIEVLRAREEAGLYKFEKQCEKMYNCEKEVKNVMLAAQDTDLSTVLKLLDTVVKNREDALKAEISELKKELKAAITERNALERKVNSQTEARGINKDIKNILATFHGQGASMVEAVEIVREFAELVKYIVSKEIYFDQETGELRAGYRTNAEGCRGPYGLRRVREAVELLSELVKSFLDQTL